MTILPTAPPVTLVLDRADDHALGVAARMSANPERGRLTVDPTPHTSSSSYLARDILHAMGRSGVLLPGSEKLEAGPAWRSITAWIRVSGPHRITVLRAHLLTPERLDRLADLREQTACHLVLIAATPHARDVRQLTVRLKEAGLAGDLQQITDTTEAISLLGPPSQRRWGPPPRDHIRHLPPLPTSGVTRFRADLRRHLDPADHHHADSQYRAGFLAAGTWLNRPTHTLKADTAPPPRPWDEPAQLRLFLARLTVTSPSRRHTLARLRGAQAGFLRHGVLLDLPKGLAHLGGPGITTVPFTPRIAHQIRTQVLNPVRAAALTALLVTGTSTAYLGHVLIAGVSPDGSHLVVNPDARTTVGEPPGPDTLYAVPPRARPFLLAAVDYRRRESRTDDTSMLFTKCFGHRLKALTLDGGMPIPALVHPHPGKDWHEHARCHRLTEPLPRPVR
ncbi:hypothetical protein [Kitasatospora sp. NPDC048407]|uniref:hypothetical protein n=1 Tax=Kitasatospora sp. NPDC048407 TaxID=3364051 RepID=UPI00371E5B44